VQSLLDHHEPGWVDTRPNLSEVINFNEGNGRRMPWLRSFDDPIKPPKGKPIVTLPLHLQPA
jgi:hypothetical protein